MGRKELVWLQDDLFEIAEEARKSMGLGRSGFYRYCIMRVLQELSLLSAHAREEAEAKRTRQSNLPVDPHQRIEQSIQGVKKAGEKGPFQG